MKTAQEIAREILVSARSNIATLEPRIVSAIEAERDICDKCTLLGEKFAMRCDDLRKEVEKLRLNNSALYDEIFDENGNRR